MLRVGLGCDLSFLPSLTASFLSEPNLAGKAWPLFSEQIHKTKVVLSLHTLGGLSQLEMG